MRRIRNSQLKLFALLNKRKRKPQTKAKLVENEKGCLPASQPPIQQTPTHIPTTTSTRPFAISLQGLDMH